MKRISLMAFLLLGSIMQTAKAQSTIEGVRKLYFNAPIKEGKELQGYFALYFKEKADKQNSIYVAEIFDNNYKQVKSFEIIRPKKSVLLEVVFNGTHFLTYWWTGKGEEISIFDKTGKQTGTKFTPKKELSKGTKYQITLMIQNENNPPIFIKNGSDGFIHSTFVAKSKFKYNIVAYDNTAKVDWTYSNPEPEKEIREAAEILEVTENQIILGITKMKGMFGTGAESDLLVLDRENGGKSFLDQLSAKGGEKLTPANAVYLKESNTLLIVGEYFKPKDNIIKDNSEGLFIQEFSITGEKKALQLYGWKTDLAKFKQDNLNPEDKDVSKKSMKLFIQDVIVSQTGSIYFIAEEMRKSISAAGVLLGMASRNSNVSNIEIQLGNMVVMQLNKECKIIDYDIIPKKVHSVLLPQGYEYLSTRTLGLYLRSTDDFDYSFTSIDAAKDTYSVVYTDQNRKEGEDSKRSKAMVGVITIKGETKTTSRIPFNQTEGATRFSISEAKPGYVSITEFFRKAKKFTFRLESIAY